jgi:hypothetical protein
MQRTFPKKKVPPDSIPNTNEIYPFMPHLGWASSLSQSLHDSSNSENRTMTSVGANVAIDDNGFQEVLSRSSKKRKNFSPIKIIFPPPAQDSPSQNLGIFLKISPNTPFEITKITTIRVVIFKLLKSMFSLNIHHDRSLLLVVQDQKSADIIINLKSFWISQLIHLNGTQNNPQQK